MDSKEINLSTGFTKAPNSIATLVQTACKFDSNSFILSDNKKINLKSIMGVMSLGMSTDKVYTIEAEGSDADDAIEALAALLTA